MKNAWLLTNKYHISDSFDKLKTLLFDSAKRHDVDLVEYNNVEVIKLLSKKNYDKPDFILFWDKDVKLASFLEAEGIKIFNTSESIRTCDDKALTYLKLRDKGINMPKTIFSPLIYYHDVSDDVDFIDFVIKTLGFPFVFKECVGSFGKQVYLIEDRKAFISKIKEVNVWPFVMQEYIKESHGKDLRLYVVGDKVVAAMKRENRSGDFRANIEIGGVGSMYSPSKAQEEMAIKAVKALGLTFGGVDILFGNNDTPILCEVNSNAYFVGINDVCTTHIEDYIFSHILSIL